MVVPGATFSAVLGVSWWSSISGFLGVIPSMLFCFEPSCVLLVGKSLIPFLPLLFLQCECESHTLSHPTATLSTSPTTILRERNHASHRVTRRTINTIVTSPWPDFSQFNQHFFFNFSMKTAWYVEPKPLNQFWNSLTHLWEFKLEKIKVGDGLDAEQWWANCKVVRCDGDVGLIGGRVGRRKSWVGF